MSLHVKDNQRAMWDAVNEFKVPPHLLRAPMSQTDRYGQKNPQSLKTSCFPQMLPTDDSCWASSNLSGRKASFCFTADRAHKSVQADGPGILLQRREAKETHKDGQFTVWFRRFPLHREKNLLSPIRSLSRINLLMKWQHQAVCGCTYVTSAPRSRKPTKH